MHPLCRAVMRVKGDSIRGKLLIQFRAQKYGAYACFKGTDSSPCVPSAEVCVLQALAVREAVCRPHVLFSPVPNTPEAPRVLSGALTSLGHVLSPL